jgi:general nucleoside transport system permease protein
VSGATLSPRRRLDVSNIERPLLAGWGGVVLGLLAFWLALPPLLVRSPVPSLVLALAAIGLGGWVVSEGQKRLGWGAVVAGVLGAIGAIAATKSGEGNLERVVVWSGLSAAMLRFATPLIFAALGGVVSERSGVVNIGLEGMMLVGAFFGIYGADLTNSWVGGLLTAMIAGGLLALLHAVFAISLRADQIVSGFAINFLALGTTGYIFLHHYGQQGTPDNVPAVPDVSLPISWIPFLGPALDNLNLLVWVALVLVFVVRLFVFRTPGGLRLRSVGENPRAAATVGISVYKVRYLAVITSGVFAALGGAFLSIGFVHSFNQNMTAGRGFIALAVVIVGKWRPVAALAAALMFGFSQALAQRLPVFSESSATLLQALPYVVTLIAVAGLVGRSTPPAADGVPYSKE